MPILLDKICLLRYKASPNMYNCEIKLFNYEKNKKRHLRYNLYDYAG